MISPHEPHMGNDHLRQIQVGRYPDTLPTRHNLALLQQTSKDSN